MPRRRSADLPEGTLPDGRRPSIRRIARGDADLLVKLDMRCDAEGRPFARLSVEEAEAEGWDAFARLEHAGLISTELLDGVLVVGVTHGGDRALERWRV